MSSSRPFLSTSVLRSKSIEAELYSPRMNVLLQIEQISRRIYTPSSAYVNIPNDISPCYGIKEDRLDRFRTRKKRRMTGICVENAYLDILS